MEKKISLVPFLIFLSLVIFFRFFNLSGRAVMGWDQARDLQVLERIVKTGKPTLIGPVAKGEGGFLLGPLYTYLLLPFFLLFFQHPLSLPITTTVLDIAFILLWWQTANNSLKYLALFWGLSAFSLSFVPISWNAYLIIPYVSFLTLVTYRLAVGASSALFSLFFFLATLALHIHASVFLLPLVFLIYLLFSGRRPSLKHTFPAFIPLLPLLVFDLRHHFINTHLFLHFLSSSSNQTVPLFSFLPVFINKLSRTLSFFLLGTQHRTWGAFLLVIVILSFFKKHKLTRLALLVFVINLFSLILLPDPNFAEYYLLPACLAALISLLIFSPGFVFLLLFLNPLFYSWATLPHSLKVKEQIVNSLVPYSPATLYFELEPGKDAVIPYLAARRLTLSPEAKYKIFIQDINDKEPNFIDGKKLAFWQLSDYKLTVYVVE